MPDRRVEPLRQVARADRQRTGRHCCGLRVARTGPLRAAAQRARNFVPQRGAQRPGGVRSRTVGSAQESDRGRAGALAVGRKGNVCRSRKSEPRLLLQALPFCGRQSVLQVSRGSRPPRGAGADAPFAGPRVGELVRGFVAGRSGGVLRRLFGGVLMLRRDPRDSRRSRRLCRSLERRQHSRRHCRGAGAF